MCALQFRYLSIVFYNLGLDIFENYQGNTL